MSNNKKTAPSSSKNITHEFSGFSKPTSNYFKLPVEWIDITAEIDNIAELKVVQYVLRHTWGYEEYGIKKRITVDEFIHGRKRKDGSRIDKGTCLSEQSVRNGLSKAIEHGYLEVEEDNSDKARIKKWYSLKMLKTEHDEREEGDRVQGLESGVQSLDPRGANFIPRSEINTQDKYLNSNNSKDKIQLEEKPREKSEFKPLASVLLKEKYQKPAPKAVKKIIDPPPALEAAVMEISRNLNNESKFRSNLTQAMNLFQEWGKGEQVFVSRLFEAQSITRQKGGVKKRMPYFFEVLKDLLGFKKQNLYSFSKSP